MQKRALAWLVAMALPFAAHAQRVATPAQNSASLQARVAALEAQVAALRRAVTAYSQLAALSPYVSVETGELNGVKGPHILFTGANVHVRSQVASTYQDGRRGAPPPPADGLGNLIIGWNERPDPSQNEGTIAPDGRYGSNNLVVGAGHQFTGTGGFVAGWLNQISSRGASVCGGVINIASDTASSVCGGWTNTASGFGASVSGGAFNLASGEAASVSGGQINVASGTAASVSGGGNNTASGWKASVSGGMSNTVSETGAYAPQP